MEAKQFQQYQRDTRKVLQVLLPSLPPQGIDLALACVTGHVAVHATQKRKFGLRRMDRYVNIKTNACSICEYYLQPYSEH